jgi:hypothetical protein
VMQEDTENIMYHYNGRQLLTVGLGHSHVSNVRLCVCLPPHACSSLLVICSLSLSHPLPYIRNILCRSWHIMCVHIGPCCICLHSTR